MRNNGAESLPAKIFIAPYNPGIFTTNATGAGQGSILVAGTASIAAPVGTFPGSRPVMIGEFIPIFGTELGAVDNEPPTGAATPFAPLARTKATPVVTIGGVNAPVTFSGLVPGFVGLYQVNAQVAPGTPVGAARRAALDNEMPSNQVTLAVAP